MNKRHGRTGGNFDNTVLSQDLVARLADGVGCAQCGREPTEPYLGYPCCGSRQCKRQLWWIARSKKVSEVIGRRAA